MSYSTKISKEIFNLADGRIWWVVVENGVEQGRREEATYSLDVNDGDLVFTPYLGRDIEYQVKRPADVDLAFFVSPEATECAMKYEFLRAKEGDIIHFKNTINPRPIPKHGGNIPDPRTIPPAKLKANVIPYSGVVGTGLNITDETGILLGMLSLHSIQNNLSGADYKNYAMAIAHRIAAAINGE